MAGLLALASVGGAETFHWTGSQDGFWTNANNWAEGIVPGRYLVPDGAGGFTTNGVLDSVVIFGEDLAGEKVTTIDFDGVYSVSNLLTTGLNDYTYGTNADQLIPIQIYGTFSGAETETTPVATVVGRLQTGVERYDCNPVTGAGLYGGETVTIRNNAAEGVLDLTRWGWSTKHPDYGSYKSHGGETGIRVEGKGTILLGPTGQGSQPTPQFVMAMEGGLLQISGTFQARTFNVTGVGDVSERRVEILESAVLRPVNYWYNWFTASRPVRFFGAGELWCSAVGYNSSQPNKWANPGFIVSADVTVECKVPATKYSTTPTSANGGLDFPNIMAATGSKTLTFKGPVDVSTNQYFPNGVCYDLAKNTSDGAVCLALDRIGCRGTSGRHGDADIILGGTSRLKYTGSGETMDRILSIGQKFSSGKWTSPVGYLEHAGTGAFRVESLVTNEYVVVTNAVGGKGRLVLVNSSAAEAVFAGHAQTDVTVKGGRWFIGGDAVFEGELQVEGDASNLTRVDFQESAQLTILRSRKGTVSTVFVPVGKTIEIDDFIADAGSAVDFVLEPGASVKATTQTLASDAVVKRNGRTAIFDASGALVPDPACPDNYWLSAADGVWSDAEGWSKGLPSTDAPTFVDQAGADYTVTLAGVTTIGDLTLANLGSGTATLSVDGTESPAGVTFDQHKLTINAGGRFVAGGAGATNVFAANTTKAFVTIADGGAICVTGGVFQVIDRGNGASPLKSGGASLISLTGNATIDVQDATFVHQGAPGNTASYFTTKEGTLRFSGSAAFKDQATYGIKYSEDLGPKNYTNDVNQKGSSVFYQGANHAAGKTAVWEFVDNAHTEFSGNPWQLSVGDDGKDGLSRVRFDTGYPDTMNLWNSMRVGARKGTGELLLERGTFKGGNYSIGIGIVDAGDKTATGASCVTGRLVVAEGAQFDYLGTNGRLDKQGEASGYTGLNVGYAAPLQAADQLAYGELVVSGWLRNQYGYLMVGVGPSGVGRVVQTAGTFRSQTVDAVSGGRNQADTAAAIGAFGGTGSFEMSGGEFVTWRPMYVGGVTTNLLKKIHQNSAYFEDYHSARGLVDVSGGVFTSTNAIVLGLDGTGTLRLGGTGAVTADSLIVSNTVGQAASSLQFVGDAEGRFGTLSVRRLVFAEGSQLVIDAAAVGEDAKSKNLLSATDGIEGLAYVRTHADLRNAPSNASLVWSEDGRSLRLRMSRGMLFIVR